MAVLVYRRLQIETGITATDYTFLISEAAHVDGFDEIGAVQSYSHIVKWPPSIVTKTALRIFQNKDHL